jgi:hypothetical protein
LLPDEVRVPNIEANAHAPPHRRRYLTTELYPKTVLARSLFDRKAETHPKWVGSVLRQDKSGE